MSDELKFAIEVVKGAEEILLKHLKQNDLNTKTKSDGSPVTVADKEAEDYIVSKTKSKYPNHSFFGEETGKTTNESEFMWIIDPIDGTKNYTRGVPLFGTLLALMKNSEIILGVSNVPLLNDMIYAEKAFGAYQNGQKITTSKITEFKNAYISSGSLHYFDNYGLKNKIVDIRNHAFQYRLIGDVYAYHLLASGKIDAVIEARTKLYDIAPFKIILDEAGGHSTDLGGNDVNEGIETFLAASNKQLHTQILRYLNP